ncbi:hydantoinase/oxoprolinase family protein [Pseudomonas sp. GX19020]|uniref:hydantoinase/oxoprolinase family protein n=1 Tax=Pseudomonas sp. GX19020 TaxID=2942277 RepID=UPI0020187910|nr:hydantoinase/oxoprolinase family protein [Pseudomonas sp. GX19020]MCL4068087.1 hydantoinase/oxoprolinase family protein [Pseudomonas sp. GX19020]
MITCIVISEDAGDRSVARRSGSKIAGHRAAQSKGSPRDMDSGKVRIGVDIGGTFTDVAMEYQGAIVSTKVLTDYTAPEAAIIRGINQVLAKAGIGLGEVDTIIHGTTLATNALIERRGAKTAFITTAGFRDVIEMRTESRFELYDLNIVIPPALIGRRDRFVVEERINAKGDVLLALDPTQLEPLAAQIEAGGYESIAIGFMHSYVNDVHERQVRDFFDVRLPAVMISTSAEVSPQMREFQRFNTVCANAYVKPLMASYLNRLVDRLRSEGAKCPVFMIHSGGGIITVESAAEFPVRLLESGPAGGAIFAADVARRHGINQVLSYDMGGTTAKICLIENALPKTAKTFEVARTTRFKKGSGMPISIPVIEMVEIGAGGGSIASVDSMRQIRVGPHSAASEPGPACYGLGGDKPTVTDADLIMGRLDPDNFAGGAMKLHSDRSTEALLAEVGRSLEMDDKTTAFGICEVVDESMANAARMHAVESGKELAEYSMIAFGGAAPLHASRLCEKLAMRDLLIPPGAGVGSAIGFLKAPVAFESVRSAYVRFGRFDAARVNTVLQELQDEARRFVLAADPNATIEMECTAYVRYVGQGWEVPVTVAIRSYTDADGEAMRQDFEAAYAQFFGRPIDGLDGEIISWSLRASAPQASAESVTRVGRQREADVAVRRDIFDPKEGRYLPAAIVERASLQPGDYVSGPAAIVERETTTIITTAYEAIMQADGCLLVTLRAA